MSEIITDKLGRKIEIKKPSTLERINFFRVLGTEDCNNPMILAETSNAMWIQSIDDKPMPKKQMVDIELIIAELEKGDANELISKHRIELFKQKQEAEQGEAELIKK
jgi:hypothetical protein